MAVLLAIGAAMIIATPNAASALPPKESTETTDINNGIQLKTTTKCENPGGNGPQSENCPQEDFEEVTDCEAINNGGNEPKGHTKKNC